MKTRRKMIALAFTLIVIGSSTFLSKHWKHLVPDNRAWKSLKNSGAFETYIIHATQHFGSKEIAADTNQDWAIDSWKNQKTSNTTEQRFLTHGIIFVLTKQDDQWKLDSLISKETGILPFPSLPQK